MPEARYFIVNDQESWKIKFADEEFGPYSSRAEAMLFAIDAAQKLGENGHFRPEWVYGKDPYPPRIMV